MRCIVPGLIALLGLLALAPVSADVAVPALQARVTDLTATLSDVERTALEQKLAAFESRKGSQLAVLLVPTTAPETIEQYGLRVAEEWRLGRKGIDDGALLLVAKNDRALRIEVGYGLEGVLTDATSRRIIDEIIVPHFRHGDFYRGIDAGVDRILAVIDGEPLPEPQRWQGAPIGSWLPIIPIVLIFTVTAGTILKALFGQLTGALITGGAAAFFTWLLLSVFTAAALAGIAAFVLTLFSQHYPGRWSSGGMPGTGGGWSGGSGGGFGGGGFSGGGGGFGGGGASGRW